MPNFKEFIKGFEEKPEAKNPNPAPTPKPQEVKMEQPKPQTKPQPKEANVRNWVKKNYPNDSLADNIRGDMTFDDLYKHMQESKDGSDFYEFASEKGKDIDSGVRENIFKGMSDYHGKPYDHFYNMWLEGGKKPEPKEGSFEKMMQGFEQPKMATEKKAEQYHEPKPKVEMDEDYERSWGPERKKDGYYKDDKGEIYLVEQGDTYYPVNEAERTEFFNAFNKQAQEAPKVEQPQQAPKQEAQTPEASLSAYFKDNSFKKSGYGDHNYENDSGEEYWVGTYEEAEEAAKDDVRNFIDDQGIGGFTDYFQDWINDYAVDENFIRQVQEEEADYYESEGDKDTAEWIRNTDPDNFQQYMVDTYGLKEWQDIIAKNNGYDIDKIVDEAVRVDGIGHFLAYWDGEEIELPNGLYAYRQN